LGDQQVEQHHAPHLRRLDLRAHQHVEDQRRSQGVERHSRYRLYLHAQVSREQEARAGDRENWQEIRNENGKKEPRRVRHVDRIIRARPAMIASTPMKIAVVLVTLVLAFLTVVWLTQRRLIYFPSADRPSLDYAGIR